MRIKPVFVERPRRPFGAFRGRGGATPFGYPVLLVAVYLGIAMTALFVVPAFVSQG
jgi:hypothetical protein